MSVALEMHWQKHGGEMVDAEMPSNNLNIVYVFPDNSPYTGTSAETTVTGSSVEGTGSGSFFHFRQCLETSTTII